MPDLYKMNRSQFLAALRDMNDDELHTTLDRARADLTIQRAKRSIGYGVGEFGVESYAMHGNMKKKVARILTEIRSREG